MTTTQMSPDLDRSLIQGIAWTGGVKWLSQAVSWGSWVLVAKLLSPDDFGLIAMATMFLGLITMLSEFGIGSCVVAMRDLSEDKLQQVHGLALMTGGVGFAIASIASVPVAWFFNSPRVGGVMVVMSIALLISSVRVVPYALLQRELRFKSLALIEAFQTLAVAPTIVLLAWLGFGYWTLVISALLTPLVMSLTAVAWRPVRPRWPRLSELRAATTFSGHVVIGRLAWYSYSNVDFLLAGRLFGERALGLYGLGWTLASMPLDKIASLLSRVTPAILSAVQTDTQALRRYFLKLNEGVSLIVFPATFGLAVVADDLVQVVFGDQWLAAVLPLRLIAVSVAFRSISLLLSQVLGATHDTRYLMRWNVATAVVMPISCLIGAQWGLPGIAAAWLLAYPPTTMPTFRRIFKRIELDVRTYLVMLLPALSGTTVMLVAVLTLRFLLPPDVPASLALVAQILTGIVTYAGWLMLVYPQRVRALMTVRDMLRPAPRSPEVQTFVAVA